MTEIQKALLNRLPKFLDLSRITTVTIPLCFGDPGNIDDGCQERFDTATRGLGDQFSNTLIIQTVGTTENPLCDKMFSFVKESTKYLWTQRFLSIPLGWGTRSEIVGALSTIILLSAMHLENGIKTSSPDFKVIIVSNKAHLRRIKWYVKIHNISHLKIEYREAKHEFGFKDTLREWIGTPLIKLKDLIRGFQKIHKEQVFRTFNQFPF
jgi:hypothetical protein